MESCDVIVIVAHPDDELFVSGTMCLCAERGFRIAMICATDGEGGDRRLLSGNGSPERLGTVRRLEATLSGRILGAHDVHFLGYADSARPDADGEGWWDKAALIETLSGMIAQARPQLILTHGPDGGYGHAAHRLVARCVMAAARKAGFQGSVFSFCAKTPNAFFSWHLDQPSSVRINGKTFLAQRTAALSYHQSQASFFLQPLFPRSVRKWLSALYGFAFGWTEAGRRRVPIATPRRFFNRFATEGLALQTAPASGAQHFFIKHFYDDDRVQIDC